MQETGVQSPSWEDHLEKEMATHPSILAWRKLMDRGACRATVHGVGESDRTERHSLSTLHLPLPFEKQDSPAGASTTGKQIPPSLLLFTLSSTSI